jgi:phosphoribosyl-AMP cyclohydrolase
MSVRLPDDVAALLKNSVDLIPAIAQDFRTGEVLMLAYMNAQSLAITLETGRATYWSRSRNELWEKGATSGHTQKVISISLDCDGDALLLQVEQVGSACHTGEKTCFHNPISLTAESGEEK